MEPTGLERNLTEILNADVKGYSRGLFACFGTVRTHLDSEIEAGWWSS